MTTGSILPIMNQEHRLAREASPPVRHETRSGPVYSMHRHGTTESGTSRSPGSTAIGWYGRPLGCHYGWYNPRRIQAGLGGLSPDEYEETYHRAERDHHR